MRLLIDPMAVTSMLAGAALYAVATYDAVTGRNEVRCWLACVVGLALAFGPVVLFR